MHELAQLSELIASVYDAAISPAIWGSALGKVNAFVGGAGAGIYAKDAVNKTGNIYFDDGAIERSYIQLYFEKYVKLDPSTTQHYFAEVDEPISTTDFIDYEEFKQTRFYKEWALPQRLVDHVTSVLEKSSTSVALFGVFRNEGQGLVDDEMRRRMRLVAPHVRRSVLISRLIDLKTAEAAAWADTLDGIRAGVILVDAAGRVVQSNGRGHAFLTAGDIVHARDGRLGAAGGEAADRALRNAILASAGGDAALGIGGIAVSLPSPSERPFIAHLLPLTSGNRRAAGATHSAVAAIFVREAAFNTVSPPQAIAETYHLTPMELRILIAIVEVGGVPAVAEARMGATTVKTHLGRLYAKIGCARQADLVKLVAGFSSPAGR